MLKIPIPNGVPNFPKTKKYIFPLVLITEFDLCPFGKSKKRHKPATRNSSNYHEIYEGTSVGYYGEPFRLLWYKIVVKKYDDHGAYDCSEVSKTIFS